MALARAGATASLTSLEPAGSAAESVEQRLCRLYYPLAFEAAAADVRPHCLQARAEITAAVTTTPAFGFAYAYTLPADCLLVYAVDDDEAEWKQEGRLLLTDEATVSIAYIRRTEDTDLLDPHFVEAVVTLLAAHLAYAVAPEGAEKRALALGQWYETVLLPRFHRADAARGSPLAWQTDTWRESRL